MHWIWGHQIVTFFSAAGLSLVLTPIAIRLARTLGIVDLPNARKVHRTPTPRTGGIAIVMATLLTLLLAALLWKRQLFIAGPEFAPVITLLIGSILIVTLGLLDDLYEVHSKYKLLALAVAATAFCGSGGVIRDIVIHGNSWILPPAVAWSVTLLWILTVTVSINFIDGLDGLAAGIVLAACAVLALGCAVVGYPLGMLLSLSLAGALTGFLFYNSHPAKVFMGDCGSFFIGYLLAGTCILASGPVGLNKSLILPAFALSIPLFDTFFTMVRRGVLERRSLFAAERGHVHHRLLDTGLCHKHVVWLLYLVTIAGALLSVVCLFGARWAAVLCALSYGWALLLLFRTAGSIRARETLTAMRRNRVIARENRKYQSVFYELQIGIRRADTFARWWEQICKAAEMFEFAKVDLPVVRRDGTVQTLRWRRDESPLAAADSILADIPIPQRRTMHTLRANIEVLVGESLESAGQRVALFSRLVGENGLDQLPQQSNGAQGKSGAGKVSDAKSNEVELPDTDYGALPGVRVAIVHDFLYVYAGAERVLEQLIKVFPQAELFSLFDFLPSHSRGFIRNKQVRASFLQKMPFIRGRHRLYLPLMPLAIEQLDVSKYDLVLSSSYVAAKGILTRPDQLHVCYCHTPVRFAWDMQGQYLGQTGLTNGIKGTLAKLILHYIRGWDVRSANGVDAYLCNSDYIRRRIEKVYRREATTVYPPVDVDFFSLHEEKEDYYMTASRMVPYKRIDLIVDAFSRMPDRRLLVVGDGPDMEMIRSRAGSNITFVGHEPIERVRRHMQMAKCFVFAAEEDFGIAPVEAQACGTPVIAFGRGGATESIVDGETGLFFATQTVADLTQAVERFESKTWDYRKIRRNAERFSAGHFREHLSECIRREWETFRESRMLPSVPLGAAIEPAVKAADLRIPLLTEPALVNHSVYSVEPSSTLQRT